jgi:HTH-type transcriptional regulator/antitoxin HigA
MKIVKKIASESDYKKVMTEIDRLMSKGSSRVTKKELADIRRLAVAAQQYEQGKYIIEPPTTLTGMIEMKMFELHMKQKQIARKLKVSDAKLSLIMSGKQKPDVNFLKAVHKELNVSGDFLLEAV